MIVRVMFPTLTAVALTGCAHDPTHVIASTATIIGVDLGQGQATQTVTGTLGYKRAEFALVPTNKVAPAAGGGASSDSGGGTSGGGAADVADVIMELNYQGIFSSGGGIYQRLAVGRNAVAAGAARTLFSKDPNGTISAKAVEIAKDGATIAAARINVIAKCFDTAGAVNAGARDPVIAQAAAKNAVQFDATSIGALKRRTTTVELAEFLADMGDAMVPGLFDALPPECR